MENSEYHDELGAQCALTPAAPILSASLDRKLADFFRARPGQCLDGRALAQVAGNYAWRTRCSHLRRTPFSMAIENKQTRSVSEQGKRFVVSMYRYVPDADGGAR